MTLTPSPGGSPDATPTPAGVPEPTTGSLLSFGLLATAIALLTRHALRR